MDVNGMVLLVALAQSLSMMNLIGCSQNVTQLFLAPPDLNRIRTL